MGLKRFDPEGSPYDLSTYFGRVRHFFDLVNPALLFVSDQRLEQAQTLLKQYRERTLPAGTSDEELWEAKKIRDAIIHPDTQEPVPILMRMVSFVPVNIPICAGMILAKPTLGNTLFWQWINQTYNAAFNYANGNKVEGTALRDTMYSYGSAATVAMASAVGFGQGLKKLEKAGKCSPGVMRVLQRMIPFTAVALAGASNIILMRYKETKVGIPVRDETGQVHGLSPAAGKKAVGLGALTRVALPIPILLLPPYLIEGLKKVGFISRLLIKKPVVKAPLEIAIITMCLWLALPAAVGLFPQVSTLPASAMEPEFQNKYDLNGKPVETFYFNKGV